MKTSPASVASGGSTATSPGRMDVSVVMASCFWLRMAGALYAALRARALAAQPLNYIGDAARSGGVALGGEHGFGELPSNRRR